MDSSVQLYCAVLLSFKNKTKKRSGFCFIDITKKKSLCNCVIQCFHYTLVYTDKKAKKIFLICQEIQKGSGAESYVRKGFLIFDEVRKYLVIYEEAFSHI